MHGSQGITAVHKNRFLSTDDSLSHEHDLSKKSYDFHADSPYTDDQTMTKLIYNNFNIGTKLYTTTKI